MSVMFWLEGFALCPIFVSSDFFLCAWFGSGACFWHYCCCSFRMRIPCWWLWLLFDGETTWCHELQFLLAFVDRWILVCLGLIGRSRVTNTVCGMYWLKLSLLPACVLCWLQIVICVVCGHYYIPTSFVVVTLFWLKATLLSLHSWSSFVIVDCGYCDL